MTDNMKPCGSEEFKMRFYGDENNKDFETGGVVVAVEHYGWIPGNYTDKRTAAMAVVIYLNTDSFKFMLMVNYVHGVLKRSIIKSDLGDVLMGREFPEVKL